MPFTLSQLLQAGYFNLGQLNERKATGGSTTTIIDTTATDGSDDDLTDGAVFIVRDAAGASAAPEGQFGRVSAFVAATGTITLDTALTSAVGAGDTYAWVSAEYPLQQMIRAANEGLRSLGDVDLTDIVTLETATDTLEYAYSAAWKRKPPFRVDIQGRTGNSAANEWVRWNDWEYVPAVAGTAGKLIFPAYQAAGYDIRVWYQGPHPTLNAYSDPVAEVLDPETAVQAFVAKALLWSNTRGRGADEFMLQAGQKAEQTLNNLMVQNPRSRVKRGSKLLILGDRDQLSRHAP